MFKINAFKFYILLALFILLPLLSYGYILTFDMSWGTIHPLHLSTSNSYIISILLNVVTILIPSWLIQKLILFLIFFLAGYGAHKLANIRNNIYAYFAGVMYVFNPFVYTRLIAGQWLVLLGYALLPWAARYFYLFLQTPNTRRTIQVIVTTTLICLTSIHTIGILSLIYLLLLFTIRRENLKQILIKGTFISGTLLILNSFWIIPLIQGNSNVAQTLQTIETTETNAFGTNGTVLESPVISAALLTGFWADLQNRYILPSTQPIWWIGAIGVISLVGIGMYVVVKKREKLGLILALSGTISLILAIGASSNITSQITATLSHILPIYSGYREPHKWLMILALAYSFLGSIGAYKILEYVKNKYNLNSLQTPKILLLFIPFLFAPTLAFGALGQLKSADYPTGWYEAKAYLETEMLGKNIPEQELDIVIFPWHQYLPISFTGRVVANPTRYFFKGNMIVSGDPELTGVPSRDPNELSRYIREEILPFTEEYPLINEKLKEKSVEYILLLKESDWTRYQWLNETNLEKVLENESLILYRVN